MEQQPEKQHFIFLELRQRLQSGLLVIRRDAVESSTKVNVSSGDSALKIHVPNEEYQVKLTPGVSLVEGSCQKSPEVNDDGLHIKLRLKVDQYTEASAGVIECLRVQKKYCFQCQSCRSMLLKDRVFKRVLPLPNGNWNTLVDDWCCHPDPFANKKLHPKQEDCLLGDTYILLSRDSGCDQSLAQEVDLTHAVSSCHLHSEKADCGSPRCRSEMEKTVAVQMPDSSLTSVNGSSLLIDFCFMWFKCSSDHLSILVCVCVSQQTPGHRTVGVLCKKCSAVLGESVTTDVIKFYVTEIVVKQSEDEQCAVPQHRQQFLERTLASRLFELSSAQSIFRFSIQTPGGKSMIMLWLLNTDTLIASFSERARSTDSLISASDRHLDEHQSCQAVCAVKVLYLPCTQAKHQEVVNAWQKDITVHPLALPESTCEEILQLLTSCTSTLPSSLRSMNSYQVAYLQR